jgi:hypothetical protein
MNHKTVLISGAGIAGPTLAFWLKAAGFEPTLIERAPALRTGGYVIDFWGLGYDIAERMGQATDINRIGYHMRANFRSVCGALAASKPPRSQKRPPILPGGRFRSATAAIGAAHRRRREQNMAKSLITQTLGGPSHGVMGLIEISDKIARLSEAGYAFETKRRELEHQFEVTNSELREEYLAAVLEIHDSPEAKITGVTH